MDIIKPRLTLPGVEVYSGNAIDVVKQLAPVYGKKVNTVVTSPPYKGLRRYLPPGHPDALLEIGQEMTDEEYIASLCDLFDAIGADLLREDGSLWVNLGDSYAGSGGAGGDYGSGGLREGQPKWKPPKSAFPSKCLMMIPERFALEMIRRGWILRNRVIWFKGKDVDDPLDDDEGGAPTSNGMPTSVEDRLKNTYEVIFHFSRQQRYFYDLNAIREPTVGQNPHDLTGGRYAPPGQTEHTPRERKMVQEMYPADKVPDSTKGRPSGVAGTSPLGRNPGDLWAIPTTPFALAHFATYPPALVHRPVKATCPEAVCKECRAPRMPIWEKGREYQSGSGRAGRTAGDIVGKGDDHLGGQVRINHDLRLGPVSVGRITGYTDCECGAGWEGGIVLDPFMGSGATAQGAFEARPPKTIGGHLCHVKVIGIDLDERNLPIIEKRLTGRAKQGRKVDLSKYNGGFLAAAEHPE